MTLGKRFEIKCELQRTQRPQRGAAKTGYSLETTGPDLRAARHRFTLLAAITNT